MNNCESPKGQGLTLQGQGLVLGAALLSSEKRAAITAAGATHPID